MNSALPSHAAWVTLASDSAKMPMMLCLTINPSHVPLGEHKAAVRIIVPDTFRPVLVIPVRLKVVAAKPVG